MKTTLRIFLFLQAIAFVIQVLVPIPVLGYVGKNAERELISFLDSKDWKYEDFIEKVSKESYNLEEYLLKKASRKILQSYIISSSSKEENQLSGDIDQLANLASAPVIEWSAMKSERPTLIGGKQDYYEFEVPIWHFINFSDDRSRGYYSVVNLVIQLNAGMLNSATSVEDITFGKQLKIIDINKGLFSTIPSAERIRLGLQSF